MKKIKLLISMLVFTGVLALVAIPSIGPAYADEEFGCGRCRCYEPNSPPGKQYGQLENNDCPPCDCYIILN